MHSKIDELSKKLFSSKQGISKRVEGKIQISDEISTKAVRVIYPNWFHIFELFPISIRSVFLGCVVSLLHFLIITSSDNHRLRQIPKQVSLVWTVFVSLYICMEEHVYINLEEKQYIVAAAITRHSLEFDGYEQLEVNSSVPS